jgi:glycerol-3-phosphate acyltransferase PlsY
MGTVINGASIVLLAYLVGSIPSAYIIGRMVGDVDVRFAGEGNVGARNAFHIVGPRWGVAVFAIDAAKGGIVGAMLREMAGWQLAVGGIAVILGHAFPVWIGFLGGKGVATASGFFAVLFPLSALIGSTGAGAAFAMTRRFLPTVIAAVVLALGTAAFVGGSLTAWSIAVLLFLLTGVKRALDEPRMRRVEASSGWDRSAGGTEH